MPRFLLVGLCALALSGPASSAVDTLGVYVTLVGDEREIVLRDKDGY